MAHFRVIDIKNNRSLTYENDNKVDAKQAVLIEANN